MKKNKVFFTGMISAMLVFGLILFIGCSPDDETEPSGPAVETPKTGDLPALPVGGTYVADKTEAAALIIEVKNSNPSSYLSGPVQTLIKAKSTSDGDKSNSTSTWNFTDQKTEDNSIKVTSSGKESNTGKMQAVGDSFEQSENTDMSAEIITVKISPSVNILTGSKFARKIEVSQKLTVTKVDTKGNVSGYEANVSQKEAYSFGLTVVNTATKKGGKIIFSATEEASFNGAYTEGTTEVPTSISGSLKVYGADDAEVYSKDITTAADLKDALAIIGW